MVINDENIKECIERNVEASRLLIAKYNEMIIGVIAFNENKKQIKTKEGEKELLNYEINDMTIDKFYEGKGIAKYLIFGVYDKLEKVHGNGVKFNVIEPDSTNIVTMRFYDNICIDKRKISYSS